MENESGFTPTGDLVLIKPPVVERKTAAGIVIVESVAEKEQKAARIGMVIAMGDEASLHSRMKGVAVGDVVLFGRYAGDFLPVKGVEYIILRAENVLGPTKSTPDYMLNAAKTTMEVEQAA